MSVLMSDLISPLHQERYRLHYATTVVPATPHHWQKAVQVLAELYQAQTILDYGSGSARKLERFSGLPVHSYDPGVPELAIPPMSADLVVCMHTLEHLEPPCLPVVLQHLTELTRKALFIVVSLQKSTKVLPDGTAWHTLVKPGEWWRETLEKLEGLRLVWPFWLPERQDAEFVCLLEKVS